MHAERALVFDCEGETLVVEDLLDRQVVPRGASSPTSIYDVSMSPGRAGEWEVSRIALKELARTRPFAASRPVTIVPWHEVPGLSAGDAAESDAKIAEMLDMLPADVARELFAGAGLNLEQAYKDASFDDVGEMLHLSTNYYHPVNYRMMTVTVPDLSAPAGQPRSAAAGD